MHPGSCWSTAARSDVLARLVACHAPGGWVVIEDYDWTGFGIEPGDPLSKRASHAILDFMAAAGFDLSSDDGGERARRADSSTSGARAGCERSTPMIQASHSSSCHSKPQAACRRLGRLTQDEADEVSARLEAPDARIITPALMAVRGRRP